MRELVHYFVVQKHSVFMPLRYCYPECLVLIEPHEAVEPLQCFKEECPANQNCGELIAKKVYYLFEEVLDDTTVQLILYFKKRNQRYYSKTQGWVDSLGACVFYKDMREPELITMNRSAFYKLRDQGIKMSWLPSDEFLFIKSSNDLIIPATNLVRLEE